MIPKEVLENVRHIEIQTKKLVNETFAGEYQSTFKGRGMEFAEVREYQVGDDIRTIDWNVSARMGHPFVKQYVEERELTVMLLVDASSSGEFGTVDRMKGEIAVEMCAVLAFSAIKNNDRVGLIIFTDKIEKYIPPKKGRKHVLRVIRELIYFKPEDTRTDISAALEYMLRVQKKKSVVFLISDFLSQDYDRALKIANRKHDVISITITDPRERSLPNIGFLELEDAETGERIMVDTKDPEVRRLFGEISENESLKREKNFRSANIDQIDVTTDVSYTKPLARFFRKRANRFR
jgi:uncharacterized protein (DUF58 family)